jgi:CheY-like chemotaxis protein
VERREEAVRKEIEGAGLGMSFVQKNREMMGGTGEVNSKYGEGSSFVITLEQEVVDASPLGDFERQLERALDLKTKDIHFKAHGVKILAVDDTEINLNILVRLLRDTGVVVETASSAEEGLQKTRETEYDMLLIDHLMPKMDGVEMLRELRTEDSNPNKKAICIALSGNGVESDLAEYRQAGFDDYLAKPVVSAKLYLMLAKYLPKEKVDPQ